MYTYSYIMVTYINASWDMSDPNFQAKSGNVN